MVKSVKLEAYFGVNMFSVLISLYDKESPENLAACLESIKEQTLKPDETVIVFDGFINDTLRKVVSRCQEDLKIVIVELSTNVGLGKALQAGLKACSNEIVARMDTDDICLPDRFEKQISYMSNNPELALLGSGIIEFDEDNNERKKILPKDKKDIILFSRWKNPFNHMTVVFRKSKVLQVGGYIHHHFMEDYNLWLRMINAGFDMENMQDILVNARVGKDMVSKRRGLKYIKSEIELMRLKRVLGITGTINGGIIFLVRSITRLVPKNILSLLYNHDRKMK